MIVLSACAGPGPSKQQVAAPSSLPAHAVRPSTRAEPARQAPTKRLTIIALDPGNYKAGQKRRKDMLVKSGGNDALTADSVGYYMEVLEAGLRRLLGETNDRITSQGESILIGPVGDAFVSDSYLPAKKIRTLLDAIAPVLKEYAETLIAIHAYTDSTGPSGYNRKLSVDRALAVAHYLVKAGVAGERIVVVGHGESDPVASNATAKGRAQNRRVEIELEPLVR